MKSIYTVLLSALCGSAMASEVFWTGAVNGTWDTSTANWQDADGVACTFTAGDDVVFPQAATDRTVNIAGSGVSAGAIMVDSDAFIRINGAILEASRLVKRGSGRLQLDGNSTFEGDIDIDEGEIYVAGWGGYRQKNGDSMGLTVSKLGNGMVERTITIGENGKLYNYDPWIFGGPISTTKVKFVVNGTLEGWGATSGWGASGIAFGELRLNSTKFSMIGTGRPEANSAFDRYWASFAWNGDVYFPTQPVADTNDVFRLSGSGGFHVGVGGTVPTLYVSDVTGNDASDVIWDKEISDMSTPLFPLQADGSLALNAQGKVRADVFDHWGFTNRVKSTFIKDGPGTLEMRSLSTSMTGDIVVKQGRLRIAANNGGYQTIRVTSPVGNLQTERSIVFLPGTALEMVTRGGTGSVYANNKLTYAMTNATVRMGIDKYGRTTSLNFGNLDFYDVDVIYPTSGDNMGGYFTMGARAKFDGSRPYVFPIVGGYSNVQLGYGSDYVEEIDDPSGVGTLAQMTARYYGCTEMTVCDITGKNAGGDCIADVTFEPALQNVPGAGNYNGDELYYDTNKVPKNRSFSCGLTKLGAGTLLLKHANNRYTGPTKVKEGALLVDGAISVSDITVYEGGLIGGTGTVSNLTVQAGGGFVVNCANPTRQLTVQHAYTVPEAGVLWLTGYEGPVELVRGLRAFSLAGADNAEAVNPSAWSVRMDGFTEKETRDVEVERDGDMLVVTYRRKGTTIVIR